MGTLGIITSIVAAFTSAAAFIHDLLGLKKAKLEIDKMNRENLQTRIALPTDNQTRLNAMAKDIRLETLQTFPISLAV